MVNVTVPVGVPAPWLVALTMAVKVTGCPASTGLADELRPVVVLALLTTTVKVDDALPLKLALPL
jgi:hypothetical protein